MADLALLNVFTACQHQAKHCYSGHTENSSKQASNIISTVLTSQQARGMHAVRLWDAAPSADLMKVACRAHDKGVTVQGAISAASAVATAACQAEDYPLPQTLLLQCPASVRKQVLPPFS